MSWLSSNRSCVIFYFVSRDKHFIFLHFVTLFYLFISFSLAFLLFLQVFPFFLLWLFFVDRCC